MEQFNAQQAKQSADDYNEANLGVNGLLKIIAHDSSTVIILLLWGL